MIKYAIDVHRIEVGASFFNDDDRVTTDWSIGGGQPDDENAVIIGYLSVANETGYGQLMLAAFVEWSDESDRLSDYPALEAWAAEGCADQMYAVARRQLSAQAALMDVNLDIPADMPEVKMDLHGSEDTSHAV